MSGLSRGAAPGLPAWKRALLERKRAKLAAGVELERGPESPPASGPARESLAERAVVAESLGPLRENPFIRLESEQRRRRRRRGASEAVIAPAFPADSPALSQLLELYGSMPGIRTIRADNILIIESREGEAAAPVRLPRQGSESGAADAPGRPGAGTPSRGRLSPGCSPVTEIRAAEVIVYEAAGRPPAAEPEAGRVSRLLQKFDREPRESAAKGKWRGGATLASPLHGDLLKKPPAPSPVSTSACPAPLQSPRANAGNFVHKIGSNSFVVTPRGRCSGPVAPATGGAAPGLSNGPKELEEAGPLFRCQSQSPPGAVPSSATPAALPPLQANTWKPKPESAAAALPQRLPWSSASPDSSHLPLLNSGCSFEIRPAPKPDLAAIPTHNLQARALASLRLNSRNSFLFVPRQKGEAHRPLEPIEPLPAVPGEVLSMAPVKPAEALVPVTYIDEDLEATVPESMPPLKVLSPRLEGFNMPQEDILAFEMEDSALPADGSHSTGSGSLFQKSTNTLTIVPQRKPLLASLETSSQAWLQEEEEEKEGIQLKAKPEALSKDPGHLKKRYPTVNEIEVIGGYLSLDKSCMSKSGVQRKKMKISFNESSLQTMFEYPSEGSLVEEEDEYATEVDKIPASFTPQPNRTENSATISSGLSSYTPKHSKEVSKWQEPEGEEMPPNIGNYPQDADLPSSQAMLTLAETSIPCDFSSEPALYF